MSTMAMSPVLEARPAFAGPMGPSGPVLFARYAFSPNRLGLCGPEDWRALLELGASGADDRGLRQLAQGFEGAYPYLRLLADEAGLPDPLDRRVVEAYWLGTSLSVRVRPAALARSLEERFRPRVEAGAWRWLAAKPAAGARATHAFHVLDIFPRLGLLRGEKVTDALKVMDSCRIRWGRVLEIRGGQLVVAARGLQMQAGRLRLGEPRVQTVERWLDGAGFVDEVAPGDAVSLHWDWACDRLDARQLGALRRSTQRQLELTNQTI